MRIALRAGASPVSGSPQILPAWNPDAGGIRAVYFRDPDLHPLELIQYPPGKGDPRWQERDRLFLGIDHTAIAASDTERSLAFYRDRLGLRIAGTSENWGVEQETLSGVPGAHVRITTLRAVGRAVGRDAGGPGIELLHYLAPRDGSPMPPDTSPDDLWSTAIVLRGAGPVTARRNAARPGRAPDPLRGGRNPGRAPIIGRRSMSLHIAILYGSVREARAGIRLVRFLDGALRRRGHETSVVDAAELRLPLLDRMYKEYERGAAPPVLEQSGRAVSPGRRLSRSSAASTITAFRRG